MTPDEKRLKEIKHRKYEIAITIKDLKKEMIKLSNEESMINGYHRIIKAKQKYKSKSKSKGR